MTIARCRVGVAAYLERVEFLGELAVTLTAALLLGFVFTALSACNGGSSRLEQLDREIRRRARPPMRGKDIRGWFFVFVLLVVLIFGRPLYWAITGNLLFGGSI
jgi:hypothetical protein